MQTHHTLKPIDAECARLYAAGKTQSEAYSITHPGSRAEPETIHQLASRLFAKANVKARVDELLRNSLVEDIISQGKVVHLILEGLQRAIGSDNSTAEAAFTKQLGSAVALFRERVFVGVEKSETDDELITRLAGGDAHKATMLRAIIGKDSFA